MAAEQGDRVESSAAEDAEAGADAAGDDGRGSKRELAAERTDWAQERTLLAKQRTFGAWLRTGLASVAVGFGTAELLGDIDPQWVVKTAAALLIVAGGVIFILGFTGYSDTFRKLQKEGVQGISPWIIGGVTLAMLLGSGLLLFAVLGE
jgi:putative membrane protein